MKCQVCVFFRRDESGGLGENAETVFIVPRDSLLNVVQQKLAIKLVTPFTSSLRCAAT